MKNLLLAVLLFTSLVAQQTHAQDYPQFEGVYVFDEETNQWVGLKPTSLELFQLALSAPIANLAEDHRGFKMIAGLTESTLAASPSVAKTLEMRIFIRSRNPQLVFVDTIVDFDSLAGTVPPGESIMRSGTPPGEILFKPAPDLAMAPNGIPPVFFNARLIDSTSTEYVLDLSNKIPDSVYGLTQCSACLMEILGFAVRTAEVGNTRAAANRFLFRTHEVGTD